MTTTTWKLYLTFMAQNLGLGDSGASKASKRPEKGLKLKNKCNQFHTIIHLNLKISKTKIGSHIKTQDYLPSCSCKKHTPVTSNKVKKERIFLRLKQGLKVKPISKTQGANAKSKTHQIKLT